MSEKIALITGSSRGIGRAIALAYAREGADVAICARGEHDLMTVAAEVTKLGRRCWYRRCDVTVKEDVFASVESALGNFGKIDILVNNAGGGAVPDYRTFLEMDDKCWFDNINVHLNAVWYFTKAMLPHMVERRSGRMINIASVGGLMGMPKLGAYAAAKHGVIGLTRTLALEVGRYGITCNAICPGATRSGWTISPEGIGKLAEKAGMDIAAFGERSVSGSALRRIIEPEEIAEMAVYLASDAGRSITGQSIAVCGGLSLH
ncbi:MAG: SDR family NAD(P)-dependent oxidoreductase [Candidatus Binataceae bacterium]